MPRKLRFAPADHYLHIVQRGNYRQRSFFCDHDYLHFLYLLARNADAHDVDALGYCLMSNHFHLIVRGHSEDSIPRFMQGLSGQYAQSVHGRLGKRGRFWQERFYSCVLNGSHLTGALRYVELNPVRAGIVGEAGAYRWSSAAIHSGRMERGGAPEWLDLATFDDLFPVEDWAGLLAIGQTREERAAVRVATQRERPLGDSGFVEQLEEQYNVVLRPKAMGRPAKKVVEAGKSGVGG